MNSIAPIININHLKNKSNEPKPIACSNFIQYDIAHIYAIKSLCIIQNPKVLDHIIAVTAGMIGKLKVQSAISLFLFVIRRNTCKNIINAPITGAYFRKSTLTLY